jgi:hypothetical protein
MIRPVTVAIWHSVAQTARPARLMLDVCQTGGPTMGRLHRSGRPGTKTGGGRRGRASGTGTVTWRCAGDACLRPRPAVAGKWPCAAQRPPRASDVRVRRRRRQPVSVRTSVGAVLTNTGGARLC